MTESLTPVKSDDVYRPISGFALGGLFVSAGFAALTLFSAVVAVVAGAPIFYPLAILIVPVAGFVLSLIGRNLILNSEGTLAGLRLANCGMALSLFSGLGYAAYFIAVGVAVAQQANDFAVGPAEPDRGFFNHLARSGANPTDLDIAFLLTRPATGRIKIGPGYEERLRTTFDQPGMDAGAGELSRFRSLMFVRMTARAGDQLVVEPLGVREWSYEKASYRVARNYRIRTPEAVFDMVVQAESSEAEAEGQGRQWFVNLANSPIANRELTPLGETIQSLKEQGRIFLETGWRTNLLDAKSPLDPDKADATNWKRLFPDNAEFMKGTKNLYREFYQNQVRALWTGRANQAISVMQEPNTWPQWGRDGKGRFWMDHPIRLTLFGAGELPTMSAEGSLRIRTREPLDPVAVTAPAPIVDWEAEGIAIERARPPRGMPQ